ncbi:MAG: sulfate/thiosulfate transport system substrate-binding protein [Thermoleophilales bacterium]|nr:sulfate/thiosulfate transport system substrate-binding protein [Thermoleophilales bacterium]
MKTLTVLLLAALTAAVAACGGTSSGSSGNSLSLVAYSTPKEAYAEIIPAFQKTAPGKDVKFSQSYGASGEQSRAVLGGLPADVVAFSLAPDVNKLVDKNLVDANWNKDQYGGFVTNSVVVLAVRKGNPKNIKTWDDLIKPGVQVIEPNPFTSGGAKWNVIAAYGAQIAQGKSEAQAQDYLKKLFGNVAVQDKSAREALQTFTSGKGDVLISYENEAITAQQKGQAIDYVVPDQTILIQNPIAVTTDAKKGAKEFVDFARTDEAQKIFAAKGYRSINDALVDKSKYPTPSALFKIDKFGGWSAVNKKFFDPAGVVGKIEQGLGVATG